MQYLAIMADYNLYLNGPMVIKMAIFGRQIVSTLNAMLKKEQHTNTCWFDSEIGFKQMALIPLIQNVPPFFVYIYISDIKGMLKIHGNPCHLIWSRDGLLPLKSLKHHPGHLIGELGPEGQGKIHKI